MRLPTPWIAALALALLGLLTSFWLNASPPSAHPVESYTVSGDAHYIFATARSLAYDGDLDLTNQLRVMGDRWGLGRDPTHDGYRLPPREIGPALLMVPGLWLHHLLTMPPLWEASMATALASMLLAPIYLSLLSIFRELRSRFDSPSNESPLWERGLALVPVLSFVLPFYAWGRAGYAHAPDALAGSMLTLTFLRRDSPRRYGPWLCVAILMRLQNFLWLLWPLLESLLSADRPRKSSAIALLQGGLWALLGVAPQLYLGWAHPGSERGPIRWGLDFFDLDSFGWDLLTVLLSKHGLLSWTPFAAIALLGLVLAAIRWRTPSRRHDWGLPALAVLTAMTLLFATVLDPDGGTAYGARRHAGCVGLLALGSYYLYLRLGSALRRPFALVLAGLTAINLGLTVAALLAWISLRP